MDNCPYFPVLSINKKTYFILKINGKKTICNFFSASEF